MDPETLLRTERTEVRGGARNVKLVMPLCDSFRIRVQGQVLGTQHSVAASVTTDEAARFEVRNVPRKLVYLRLDGVDCVPLEWGRHVEGGLDGFVGESFEDLEIEIGRRCHFLVELLDPDEADQIGVLDDEDELLVISEFLGEGRREREQFELTAGRSNPLGVSDRAASLVLYLAGEEVRRVLLHLSPGRQTTVTALGQLRPWIRQPGATPSRCLPGRPPPCDARERSPD